MVHFFHTFAMISRLIDIFILYGRAEKIFTNDKYNYIVVVLNRTQILTRYDVMSLPELRPH